MKPAFGIAHGVRVLLACLALVAAPTHGTDTRVYQADRYGNKQQQIHVIKGNRVYETDKYGNQKQQTHIIKDDRIYQTDKYGNIQYHKPALVTK